MSYCLVVVDMQPGFETAHKRETIEACTQLVRQAVQDQAEIIVLEYESFGETFREILEPAEGYSRIETVGKGVDDGSEKLMEAHHCLGFQYSYFKVCGVNWQYCVYKTVMGLQEYGGNIVEVIEAACNGPDHGNWEAYRQRYVENGVQILLPHSLGFHLQPIAVGRPGAAGGQRRPDVPFL